MDKFTFFIHTFCPDFTAAQVMQYQNDHDRAFETIKVMICSECYMKITENDITAGGKV